MIALAVLLFIVAAFLLGSGGFLACIAVEEREDGDRPLAAVLAAGFVICAGIAIAGGVVLC